MAWSKGAFGGISGVGRADARRVKRDLGVLSTVDATRMAKRENPEFYKLSESMFPESVPDPEEAVRRNRRKFLASMRQRSGRLSTIYTGGAASDSVGLG